jgi:hypothetical protein
MSQSNQGLRLEVPPSTETKAAATDRHSLKLHLTFSVLSVPKDYKAQLVPSTTGAFELICKDKAATKLFNPNTIFK